MNSNNSLNIRLNKSFVGEEEAHALRKVIVDSGYLGMGKQVQFFENELTSFLKTDKKVVCVNSGTAALHLALEAVVSPGDEVLVQSMTYIATYQAISAARAKPVSCDVNSEDLTINLEDAEKKITHNTKAIIPVHYSGNPGNIDAIYEFAKKHNLRVIEDAAHAFGSKSKKQNDRFIW